MACYEAPHERRRAYIRLCTVTVGAKRRLQPKTNKFEHGSRGLERTNLSIGWVRHGEDDVGQGGQGGFGINFAAQIKPVETRHAFLSYGDDGAMRHLSTDC